MFGPEGTVARRSTGLICDANAGLLDCGGRLSILEHRERGRSNEAGIGLAGVARRQKSRARSSRVAASLLNKDLGSEPVHFSMASWNLG
jgi:hypothetical protein